MRSHLGAIDSDEVEDVAGDGNGDDDLVAFTRLGETTWALLVAVLRVNVATHYAAILT